MLKIITTVFLVMLVGRSSGSDEVTAYIDRSHRGVSTQVQPFDDGPGLNIK